MNGYKIRALAVVLALAAPPAWAQSGVVWTYCMFDSRKEGVIAEISPVFSIAHTDGPLLKTDWFKRMEAETKPERFSSLSCGDYETLAEAESEWRRSWKHYTTNFVIRTIALATPPEALEVIGAPAAAPKVVDDTSNSNSTAHLTVETDTSLRDSVAAWDEQVRKTLAAEADRKVALAAKQAQADAQRQADIRRYFEERRRQGNAQ